MRKITKKTPNIKLYTPNFFLYLQKKYCYIMILKKYKPIPGTDGNKYVPYEKRTGNESVVYFTRNLSAEGLIKAY